MSCHMIKLSSKEDVQDLVNMLKRLFANPYRLHLFESVRPFIAVEHQMKYDRLCPFVPGKKLKTVRLLRHGIEDLGFKIRGGLDFGTGIFVSEVVPESLADIKGLKPGDEIIRINGYSLGEAIHSEILALLKIRNQTLELKIRRMGLVPIKTTANESVSWMFVAGHKSSAEKHLDQVMTQRESATQLEENDRKVFVNLSSGAKLGCGIGSNQEWGMGIYVCRVTPDSVADTLGFKVGDQVIEVNGISYLDISHDEAVLNMKTSRYLTIVLRSRRATQELIVTGRVIPKSGSSQKRYSNPGPPVAQKPVYQKEVSTPPITIPADIIIEPRPKSPEPLYAEVKKKPSSGNENWSYGPTAVVARKQLAEEINKKPTAEVDWWEAIPSSLFSKEDVDGRDLRKVEIVKDGPLNMFLEGGNKTVLGGKIVVADLYPDGAAFRSKNLFKGDQIMMLEGVSLVNVTLEEAEIIFKENMGGKLDGSEKLRMIVAVAPPKSYEDEITFF